MSTTKIVIPEPDLLLERMHDRAHDAENLSLDLDALCFRLEGLYDVADSSTSQQRDVAILRRQFERFRNSAHDLARALAAMCDQRRARHDTPRETRAEPLAPRLGSA